MTKKVKGTLNFKRGSIYDRNTIWEALYPGDPLPTGGDWNTGYALADNYENLIIFMNSINYLLCPPCSLKLIPL